MLLHSTIHIYYFYNIDPICYNYELAFLGTIFDTPLISVSTLLYVWWSLVNVVRTYIAVAAAAAF